MFDEITNNGYVSEHICRHLMATVIILREQQLLNSYFVIDLSQGFAN
jgi:hypothetical protein